MATELTPEQPTALYIGSQKYGGRGNDIEKNINARRMERVSFKAEADRILSVLLLVPGLELELEPAPGLVPPLMHGGPPPLVGPLPLVGHSPASSKAVIVVLALGLRRR